MTESKGSSNRRRVLMVDRDLQRDFILQVVTVPILAMVATVTVVGIFSWRLKAQIELAGGELSASVPLFSAVLTFFLASGYAMYQYAARVSNRVVGPQLNVRRTVERFFAGDHDARVNLRTSDYMHTVADDLNRVLDELARRMPDDQRQQSEPLPEPAVAAAASSD